MSRVIQIIIPQGSPKESEAQAVAKRFETDRSVVKYMGSSEVMSSLEHARTRYMEVRHDGSEKTWVKQITILMELSNYRAIVERENGVVQSVQGYGLGDEIKELKFSTTTKATEKKSGCFVSTAACEHMGMPDDCHELFILRKFRDEFLSKNERYKNLISEYYEVAPKIVSSGILKIHYFEVWEKIVDIVKSIENDLYEDAIFAYQNMVHTLIMEHK